MRNTWMWVILIVIAAGVLWWWSSQTPSETSAPVNTSASSVATEPTPTPTATDATTTAASTAPMTATITYNGTSFTPSEVTIKKGGTVTWVNASGKDMWVASAMHPTHIVYSGTSRTEHCPDTSNTAFDQCQGDGDYSFTFDKTGTWGYHDHLNSSAFGKVVVE